MAEHTDKLTSESSYTSMEDVALDNSPIGDDNNETIQISEHKPRKKPMKYKPYIIMKLPKLETGFLEALKNKTAKLNENNNDEDVKTEEPTETQIDIDTKNMSKYPNLPRMNSTSDAMSNDAQIFFGCIAPLREDRIDVYADKTTDVQLHYCCGLLLHSFLFFLAFCV